MISKFELKNVKETLNDEFQVNDMQEKLVQFKRNEVWGLISILNHENIIRTKWIYKNKSYDNRVVTKNKARLMARGYTQIEGIDFDKTFVLVA